MVSVFSLWILIGFACLAMVAGLINAVALLHLSHAGVTHVTGLVSQSAIEVGQGEFLLAKEGFWIIGAFFSGAFLCGFLIRESHFKVGRRYGYTLLVEAALLCVAFYFWRHHIQGGLHVLALASGLQNALVSHVSGAIVRTTHMTGIVTDLAVLLSHKVMQKEVDNRRFKLFASLLGGFFVGGLAGAWGYGLWGEIVLLAAAGLIAFLAISYIILRHME